MKRVFFLIIALVITLNTFAQSKQTVVKSSVTYEIKNMGIKTDGKLGGLQANILFDKAKLDSSSIEASIDVTTIDSDNAMRDNHLKAEDYFDVARYPHITMRSTSFKHKSGNNYIGLFNITIKGKTKAVEVPFTYTDSATTGLFKGSFKINRRDFGVGGNSMVLADDATILISVETSKT
ncbi:YceI family protein [Mucilaginibacter sp. Bleaf8]|uniref:YceI family protein n=1 Tax=Mucilaginibacter sp. Bleaf8 TaxID=2834430 RepID=UPI001BD0944F|nr:YceI family protein [Mucilaginibacter sp. Bleaf8]MBS7566207.1 YceI family protein [Mucilaginibacter sp. Bleaf8]